MVPELKPKSEEILRHLQIITARWAELGQPCALELVFLSAEDRAQVKNVAHFPVTPEGLAEAADHAEGMNRHGINAYAVINPLDATALPQPGKRAAREHILASFFHWADADTAEAANNIRNFVGPKCTYFVLTGTQPCQRPHVYWELEEPTRNLDAWERTQKAIAATLRTDSSVTDPPRIMRLAGTINWPKPQKREKGYIAEVTTLRVYDEDERPRISSERMARAFSAPERATTPQAGLSIDTGTLPTLDRERATIQALSGMEWHNAVIRLVASYVAKGLSDAEIHALTAPLTLPGYTTDETAREVQTAIDGARRKGWTPEAGFAPNFDHAPAPTPHDPAPQASAWIVQRADQFTADFVAPEYLIDGVIQRGRIYTLTAPTGSGKTAVMLYAATAIATGNTFCEREVEHGDVLFMAGENPDDVRARVIATMEFYGIDPATCRLHFIAGTFSIRADMERLRAEAARLPNLLLVVIDTFAAYFDGDDENSNAQALDFARLVRKIAAFDQKPAVIMPAHPVKNATRGNLSPKGGSSLLNEVDGNLTLWNEEGVLSMHWQGKFRGADFEPFRMELHRYETPTLHDQQGRLIPTILAKPLMQMRATQIARETLAAEDRILLSISDAPELSIADRCIAVDMRLADGSPAKSTMFRALKRLSEQKLIRRFRTNWELTKGGEKAVEIITTGGKFAPDLEV